MLDFGATIHMLYILYGFLSIKIIGATKRFLYTYMNKRVKVRT